jgi:hypothetical protein
VFCCSFRFLFWIWLGRSLPLLRTRSLPTDDSSQKRWLSHISVNSDSVPDQNLTFEMRLKTPCQSTFKEYYYTNRSDILIFLLGIHIGTVLMGRIRIRGQRFWHPDVRHKIVEGRENLRPVYKKQFYKIFGGCVHFGLLFIDIRKDTLPISSVRWKLFFFE